MSFDRARRNNRIRRRWSMALFVATLALLLAACSRGLPQSSLEPAGPRAETIDGLFQIVFWIAVGVFVLVEGAIVYISIRYRRRKGREETQPVQIHGNNRLEILWTIVPALLLAGLAFPTISTIFDLSRRPAGDDVLQVTVVGHQWWWEFQYPDLNIVTANELHIPVDTPVDLRLEAKETPGGLAGFDDAGQPIPENAIPVIHSFWVPRLSGKQDLVPGRVERMSMEASAPGTYLGQCAEFCGISHANMRLRVVADTAEDFDAWVDSMKAQPGEPEPGSPAAEGAQLFQSFGSGSCLACHAIDPSAGNAVGPNLAHLASRETFGSGLFELNEENLARWLENPRAMKPGVVMPDYGLTGEQAEAIAAYLLTLE